MEHLLKPPQPIEEVVAEVFLKKKSNFVSRKTSTLGVLLVVLCHNNIWTIISSINTL
jgi:hypothetical protein